MFGCFDLRRRLYILVVQKQVLNKTDTAIIVKINIFQFFFALQSCPSATLLLQEISSFDDIQVGTIGCVQQIL